MFITASVDGLRLDPQNPRLPEDLRGASQTDLFTFLWNHGVLDELVDSMLDNGFFSHEPLIVLPKDTDGKRIVVEGNRRLAALMLIFQRPETDGRGIVSEPTPEQLDRLQQIPVAEVPDRAFVETFLGYRHISGMKPWPAEAKARYVAGQVDALVASGTADPLLHVARRVGSNTQGVRNQYVAFAMLRRAHDECGVDIGHVLNERFGVWLRAMNSPQIRRYVGLGDPRSFSEVSAALNQLQCAPLGEVIGDLSPRRGKPKAVLGDSRDVTVYGQVLENTKAREILRKYDDLGVARQLVEEDSLPDKALAIHMRIASFREEVLELSAESSKDLVNAVTKILVEARVLHASVIALANDADD